MFYAYYSICKECSIYQNEFCWKIVYLSNAKVKKRQAKQMY